ncbi:helix-turn-helix domain-containing protein [Streptosporangium sp. NPDC023963]|uniref:helix-turn-helix domain-containing protein n=1 Tax=Streptosporangium sp. NPDC023963 TaxID=3155608 RepID=UPI003427F413
MGLPTIGAFAQAARLSPKALRLYDELGLLRPAAVDGESGYRFYDPTQLERARLIAWLRRLGMPPARIRRVCDLEPEAAAEQVAGYWAQVMADTAARGQLATFLVDYLSGRGSAVEDAETMIGIRYAARSESGLVRTSNEDVAYAGARLPAVADGARGPGGNLASAAAIDALKPLEARAIPAGDLLGARRPYVLRAGTRSTGAPWPFPPIGGCGSTTPCVAGSRDHSPSSCSEARSSPTRCTGWPRRRTALR